MSDKILSIIIPSYNMEAYLPKCLESLVIDDRDLFGNLDVIVVNDGSKDKTSEIAHKFETKYPDVFRVIDKENGNYGSCINAGLSCRKGAYVKILDADDRYDSDAFLLYMRFVSGIIDSGNSPDLIFNDFDEVDSSGNILKHVSYGFVAEPAFSLAEFDYVTKPMVWAPAIAYKSEIFDHIDYHQSEGVYYSDQEWDTIPMLAVKTTTYFPKSVYKYLIGRTDQSCNEDVKVKNFAMHFPVAIKILSEYAKHKYTAPAANLTLVANQIRFHIRFFYQRYLLNPNRLLSYNDLIKYDKALKVADSELYSYASSLCTYGRYKMLFVTEWRKHYSRTTFKFFVYDTYVKLVGLKQGIMNYFLR